MLKCFRLTLLSFNCAPSSLQYNWMGKECKTGLRVVSLSHRVHKQNSLAGQNKTITIIFAGTAACSIATHTVLIIWEYSSTPLYFDFHNGRPNTFHQFNLKMSHSRKGQVKKWILPELYITTWHNCFIIQTSISAVLEVHIQARLKSDGLSCIWPQTPTSWNNFHPGIWFHPCSFSGLAMAACTISTLVPIYQF